MAVTIQQLLDSSYYGDITAVTRHVTFGHYGSSLKTLNRGQNITTLTGIWSKEGKRDMLYKGSEMVECVT